jgi:hypothetical protein
MVSSFLVMMAISRWPIVALVMNHTENTMFHFPYDPTEKHPIFVSITDQVTASAHVNIALVLKQGAWNTVLSNMRHVQVIRENFVASTKANACCCCDFIYHLGAVSMRQNCNFLDLGFSSDCSWLNGTLIIFKTISPLYKTFVPIKHSTMAQGFFTECLLYRLKCFARRFA